MPSIEEYTRSVEHAMQVSEEAAKAAIETKVRIEEICGRIERSERTIEGIVKTIAGIDSPIHKAEICPYQDRLREAQRVIWGDKDAPGLIGDRDRMQKEISKLNSRINKLYGALAAVGAIALTLLPIVISKL